MALKTPKQQAKEKAKKLITVWRGGKRVRVTVYRSLKEVERHFGKTSLEYEKAAGVFARSPRAEITIERSPAIGASWKVEEANAKRPDYTFSTPGHDTQWANAPTHMQRKVEQRKLIEQAAVIEAERTKLRRRAERAELRATVQKAIAVATERHAAGTQQLLEKISREAVTAAGGVSALGRQLNEANAKLQEIDHQLMLRTAERDGFRARAEKAEGGASSSLHHYARVQALLHEMPADPVVHRTLEESGMRVVDGENLDALFTWLTAMRTAVKGVVPEHCVGRGEECTEPDGSCQQCPVERKVAP